MKRKKNIKGAKFAEIITMDFTQNMAQIYVLIVGIEKNYIKSRAMKKLIKGISDFFTGTDIHSEFMAQYPILFFRYLLVIVFVLTLVFGLLGKLD